MNFNFTAKVEDITAMPPVNATAGLSGAGQVTMTIPRLGRVKRIRFRLTRSDNLTVLMSAISRVQVKLGGGIQRRCAGVRLDALNALNGAQYGSQAFGVSGTDYERHFSIHCEEPWRTRITAASIDPNALGWNTLWTSSNKPLQVIVDLVATGTANVNYSLTAEVDFDDGDNGKENAIIRWEEDDFNCASTLASIANIDSGLRDGEGLVQISAFAPAATNLTSLRFEWGKTTICPDRTIRSINAELINAGMSPAASDAALLAGMGLHQVNDKNDSLNDVLMVGVASSLFKVAISGTPITALPIVRQILGMPNKS